MRFFLSLLTFSLTSFVFAQEVIITGLMDGTAGGTPRAIEIYVSGTMSLDGFRLERSANSNNFPDAQLDLTGTYTDAFLYVVNNQTAFADAFGSAEDFGNVTVDQGLLSVNGNDAFRILRVSDGTVIDQTGGEEADNDAILYRDGYLYRNNTTGPDGGWVAANWTNELDVLDGLSLAEMGNIVPFGTFTTTPPPPSVNAIADGDLAEPSTNGGFFITLSQVANAAVTVNYTLAGSATIDLDYTDAAGGSVVIPAGQLSVSLPLVTVDDQEAEFDEQIELSLTGVSDTSFSLGIGATISIIDNEPAPAVKVNDIQGAGTTSPLVGETVMIEGIVVGDFQGGDGVGLGGFFLQEEDADADEDPLTSEGIWVFDEVGSVAVNLGDQVRVTGTISEFQGLTEIDVTGAAGQVNVLSSNNTLPTAAGIDLPVAAISDYERWEGMLVTLIDPVSVTSNFGLGRYGEIEVSVGERLIQYTECNDPDAAGLAAFLAQQQLGRLIVDDGRSGENTFPISILGGTEVTAINSFRSGRTLTGLTGIMDERFGQGGTAYRIQGTGFTSTEGGARPIEVPAVGGEITVVGMNVLNYFTTLGSRGASNALEFTRQQDKIVKAICALDADIVGLIEIENNGFGPGSALQTLIDAIATECGTSYAAVVVPDGDDPDNAPDTGTDQIQVALIYKTATVKESGTVATLTEPIAVFTRNRVPVTQTFQVIEEGNANMGQEITVCVNHWKSKGSGCGPGDDDPDGGAGNCNITRNNAAVAILNWLATDPTGSGETDQLIIGDLNAYSEELPLKTLVDAGFVNAVRASAAVGSFPCGSIPSYVFRGEWGSLDHAFVSTSAATKVTGAAPWQICAAEPIALDYNTDFNSPALYNNDVYRFSDHDPVIVGLDLGPVVSTQNIASGSPLNLSQLGPKSFRLSGTRHGDTYTLLTAAGALVRAETINQETVDIEGVSLPAGVYFLLVHAKEGRSSSFKLLFR